MSHPHETDVTPRDEPPSAQVQEGHAADVDPQPEVAAQPSSIASSNLNAPSSVLAAELSSNADGSPAGEIDNGPSQEDDTIKEEKGAQVTDENSVVPAKHARQDGHTECDGEPQLEPPVVEPTGELLADTTPAPVLDETTAHTNETSMTTSAPSREGPGRNEPGGTDMGKEPPEYATVAHGDAVILEAVPANDQDSARDEHGGENSVETELPADITPTPVPNETTGHSETDEPLSSQQEPAERIEETLTTVPMVDRAKEESAEDPSQPTIGDQDPRALPLSAETTEVATSQAVELVIQAAEPIPSSDPACETVNKGAELATPPHVQTEVEGQSEGNAIATGEPKEEALPMVVDVEDPTSAQCPQSAVKETGQADSSQQEEGTTSAALVHEAPTHALTDAQDSASAEPAEGTPHQSMELASAAPDLQANTKDPVVPSLPLVDRAEATNDQPDLAEDPTTTTSPPEEPAVNVQAETEECESSGVPKEDGDDLVSNAEPSQREVKQDEAVELTEGGMY
jgi:hypothetical protein